jgi:hypothetical protein
MNNKTLSVKELIQFRNIVEDKLRATNAALAALDKLSAKFGLDLNATALRDIWLVEVCAMNVEIVRLQIKIDNRMHISPRIVGSDNVNHRHQTTS